MASHAENDSKDSAMLAMLELKKFLPYSPGGLKLAKALDEMTISSGDEHVLGMLLLAPQPQQAYAAGAAVHWLLARQLPSVDESLCSQVVAAAEKICKLKREGGIGADDLSSVLANVMRSIRSLPP